MLDSRGGAFSIQRMTEGDSDRVMRIWLESNLQAHDFVPEAYWRGQYENVRQMIPAAEVYVCETDRQIAGFIGLAGNYIAGLFVDAAFRLHGVGKRLLDYARCLKPSLTLNVYQKNCRAVRFYQRKGFVVVREGVDHETGEKDYLMKCGRSYVEASAK